MWSEGFYKGCERVALKNFGENQGSTHRKSIVWINSGVQKSSAVSRGGAPVGNLGRIVRTSDVNFCSKAMPVAPSKCGDTLQLEGRM